MAPRLRAPPERSNCPQHRKKLAGQALSQVLIAGWVRNRRDGSVEAVIAGSLEEVDRMTAAVRRGPPGARVETADVSQAGDEDLRQRLAGELFSVLRTI